MASKVCGRRSGVAKQATVIPVVLNVADDGNFSIDSVVTATQLVLADIIARRSPQPPSTPSALEKKTVMMMAINIDIEDAKYIEALAVALQAIMDLGVIVAVPAGNYAFENGEGFVAKNYPAWLAVNRLPSLIRVGVVDQNGIPPKWAQQGDVYACGVGILCANPNSFSFRENGAGACASLAAFAGLVAYNMGLSSVPYEFGDDPKQYQSIVKRYHTSGPGSWVRPRSNVKTVWNGLDGSANTYCPLRQRKRDDDIDDTCNQSSSTSSDRTSSTFNGPSISLSNYDPSSTSSRPSLSTSSRPSLSTSNETPSSTFIEPSMSASNYDPSLTSSGPSVPSSTAVPEAYTPMQVSIVIYYNQMTGCSKSSCVQTYFVYAEPPGYLPLSTCSGWVGHGSKTEQSIDFQIRTGPGFMNFTYSRANDQVGEVTGTSLSTPVTCVAAPSPTPSQICEAGDAYKRAVGPIGNGPFYYTYYEWAACIWYLP